MLTDSSLDNPLFRPTFAVLALLVAALLLFGYQSCSVVSQGGGCSMPHRR